MTFYPEFIIFEKTVISIRSIESMEFPDGEDLTAAKLKDDSMINVVMCSGKEYTISTRAQFPADAWRLKDEGVDAGRRAIFEKWKHILMGKS